MHPKRIAKKPRPQESKPSQITTRAKAKAKKAQKKAKPQLHTTVLSPADRLGAEQILHELIEIRSNNEEI